MDVADIEDTTAFRIARQVLEHCYGDDEDFSKEDFAFVSSQFRKSGGSWEAVMSGDMRSVKALEDSLAKLVTLRRIANVAARVAAGGR